MAGALAALSPSLAQPLPAAAAGSGTLFAITGNQDVLNRVDPVTGALTPIANLAGSNQGQTGTLTVDPVAHLIYAVRTSVIFVPPTSINIVNEVLTISTVTGAFTTSKPVNEPVNQIVFDSSTHSLLFDGVSGIFKVDPVTGGVIALTHLSSAVNQGMSGMAVNPATHTLYVNDEVPQPDGNFASNILTIDSQTGAVRSDVPLGTQVGFLGFDTAGSALLSTAGCCTPQLVGIDPAVGTLTPIATISSDPNVQLAFTMAIDPSSRTVFMIANSFVCCWSSQSQIVSIDEASGTPTFSPTLADGAESLLFVPDVTVTPDSVKADVEAALASGTITKAGIAKTLLADLSAAQAARNRGQCSTAGNIYQQFIADVSSQTGKSIDVATASRFVSEAQFLIANCP
jgi:hypothetical protein